MPSLPDRGRDPRRYHRSHQRWLISGGLVDLLGGPVYLFWRLACDGPRRNLCLWRDCVGGSLKMPRGPRGLYGLSIIPVIAAITIIRFVTRQVASIWGAPKLGLGVMRRVPLYFLFGEPATTVGQSRPSREALASGDAKKNLRWKARALATRGKPRAVQSRKGVVRTATKVIAPAGAARRSRKAASRATSASRLLADEQHFAWHAPRARGGRSA